MDEHDTKLKKDAVVDLLMTRLRGAATARNEGYARRSRTHVEGENLRRRDAVVISRQRSLGACLTFYVEERGSAASQEVTMRRMPCSRYLRGYP
jgi:hypothetical protein